MYSLVFSCTKRTNEPTDTYIRTHTPTLRTNSNDLEGIGAALSEHNRLQNLLPTGREAIYLVDACQSVGQRRVSVRDLRCHVLAATGRKYLRGPRGTGFLYVLGDLADCLVPSHVDHYGAPVAGLPTGQEGEGEVEGVEYGYRGGARRMEFWERSRIPTRHCL